MSEKNISELADVTAQQFAHYVESVSADLSPLVIIPASLMLAVVVFIGFAAIAQRRRERLEIETAFSIKPASSAAPKKAPPLAETGKASKSSAKGSSTSPIQPETPVADTAETFAEPSEVAALKASSQADWLVRLKGGLTKTRNNIANKVGDIFKGAIALDTKTLESIHEILYRADIGVKAADQLIDSLKSRFRASEKVTQDEVMAALKDEIASILTKSQAKPLDFKEKPHVILVVGVNGVGKTTTIGKLAAHFMAEGQSVLFGASDTFRAAAIDQLKEWGKRLSVDVIAHKPNSDPAAVAFDAAQAAKSRNSDCLIVDTAGRLHSKTELMEELAKIKRVLGKEIEGAPHEVWLVLDSTTGQNAISQAKAFKSVVDITGLVITKLDGTAKGGVVVGISMEQKLPIRYIGVGEGAEDLRAFNPSDFASSLFDSP